MSILKSIGSIVAGFMAATILSLATDMILSFSGLLEMQHFNKNSPVVIGSVIIYRFLFNTSGCFLAARLAPAKPMQHAMGLGFLGFMTSIIGGFFMWDQAPVYYNLSFPLLAFPAAWLGGSWYTRRKQTGEQRVKR